MTKKHFIALADCLKVNKPLFLGNPEAPGYSEVAARAKGHEEEYDYLVLQLAGFCTSQNPRFNRERWLGYIKGECGPNGGKVKP